MFGILVTANAKDNVQETRDKAIFKGHQSLRLLNCRDGTYRLQIIRLELELKLS